jgi:hypothetical protein
MVEESPLTSASINPLDRSSLASAELSGSLPRRVGYCVLPPLLNGSKKR